VGDFIWQFSWERRRQRSSKRQGAGAAKSPGTPGEPALGATVSLPEHAVVEPRGLDRGATGRVALLRRDRTGCAEARGAATGGIAAECCGLKALSLADQIGSAAITAPAFAVASLLCESLALQSR